MRSKHSVGIIGGADGPTQIVTSFEVSDLVFKGVCATVLALIAGLSVFFCKELIRRRHKS